MFTCMFANFVSVGQHDLPFSQQDMPQFRRRMALDFLNGTLED